jgi:hypothetical protein
MARVSTPTQPVASGFTGPQPLQLFGLRGMVKTTLAGVAAMLCLVAGVWSYDAFRDQPVGRSVEPQRSDSTGNHPEAVEPDEARRLREALALLGEARDIEAARRYSLEHPLDFPTRSERYQAYLNQYPHGRFVGEVMAAVKRCADDWNKHDFRAVRDHFQAKPGDTAELVARCRAYLAVHPQGRFAGSARQLLRWTEKVTVPGEYHVKLRDGMFDRKVAHFFSRGPKLSVELEINGVRYGPSPIILNRYDPVWNYDFPRPIRWKLGDAVRIRVTEHSWRAGVVVDMASADGDPTALALLTGDVWSGKNRLTFECTDFRPPILPDIE